MKTTENLHTAAAAKLEQVERAYNKLFAEVKADPDGEKHWQDYKSRYDAIDRIENKAYRVYWYTNSTIDRRKKQANHRLTVAKMHAAGLHRLAL